MVKEKWKRIKRPEGTLYFKQHPTRKHGVKYDRYHRAEYQHNHKRIALNFGWISENWTESACLQKLKYFKNNAKAGIKPINFKQEKAIKHEQETLEKRNEMTLDNFFENVYLPAAKNNKRYHTMRVEEGYYRNWIKPEVGHLEFNYIKPFNIEKIKKTVLDAGKMPRTLQYILATFRQIWNHARFNDIVSESSPTKKVKIPKVENKRTRFLTTQEANLLLDELKTVSCQVHNMTLLSLHTGMRAKEIFSLTWGLVDFGNDCISVRDSKGGSRFVYLTNTTKTMLKKLYCHQVNNDLVFKNRKGNQIKNISKAFFRKVENLGFNNNITDSRDKVIFHTLRHTFASWHVQNGTDLYTVKELLGHSTIQLTERYSHLRPDGLKTAARNFDKIAGSSNSANHKKQNKKIVRI